MSAELIAENVQDARRHEKAPSGGWRTIGAKEFADHLGSVRFYVLLLIIGIAAAVPLYFTAQAIRDAASQASGTPAIFLLLFSAGAQNAGGIPTVAFVAMFVPLVGIAFGFDAVNSERAQGTLSRLLAQPIHRDDVINGKFAAGIAIIALMLTAMVALIAGFGMVRLGIIPTLNEVLRVIAWLLVTILYAGFWLAFGLLLSVVMRRAASAALVGFGTWLGVILFGAFLLPLLANAIFPANVTGSADDYFASTTTQQLFLRISPAALYQDAVTAIMNPAAKTVLGVGSLQQYVSAQEQIPSLLSLDQSMLIVWPQIVVLVALTVGLFAMAYVVFLRQEVRA
jgi:ABC-2 type transport system permease protein